MISHASWAPGESYPPISPHAMMPAAACFRNLTLDSPASLS
jgi:hypothetical protein